MYSPLLLYCTERAGLPQSSGGKVIVTPYPRKPWSSCRPLPAPPPLCHLHRHYYTTRRTQDPVVGTSQIMDAKQQQHHPLAAVVNNIGGCTQHTDRHDGGCACTQRTTPYSCETPLAVCSKACLPTPVHRLSLMQQKPPTTKQTRNTLRYHVRKIAFHATQTPAPWLPP